MYRSSFDIDAGEWQIGWPGRVSRHDLVYLSPPGDPMQGMPLGNGDIGVLCWCEDSKVIFAVNKCDLWDDLGKGPFHNWKADEEEHSTTLRHACRIVVDFGMPVWDIFYLSDFHGRLSLPDAALNLHAVGPFGSVTLRACVDHDSGVFWCEVDSRLDEDVPVDVMLQRFGSRTFSHWYKLVNRDASIGLGGTEACVSGTDVYVEHKLSSGTFAAGCRIVEAGPLSVETQRDHSRCARLRVHGGANKHFTLFASVTSPANDGIHIEEAQAKLDAARSMGVEGMLEPHRERWKSFWLRSFMESGDDYLDNLWHLNMYYAYASQRGRYPGRFIGGLWGWNRDVQPWNFYFHWNQQTIYWPLNAAGHHDLLNSYLDYRFNSLPHAREDAGTVLHADGAIVSDACERRGYNSTVEFANHTPVAEIALDFWRQYQFTGDEAFLRERVVPYMREAACFFESLFYRGDDSLYHARRGTAYEGWIELRDVITEIAYGNALLRATIEACKCAGIDEPRVAKWAEIAQNLAPFATTSTGNRAALDEVFAAGYDIDRNEAVPLWLPSDDEPERFELGEVIELFESKNYMKAGARTGTKLNDGLFPTATTAPVFPSSMIGLSGRGSELFNTAVNTVKFSLPDCMGWDPVPIALARLGLADELWQILAEWPHRWQFYCNGWGHYGPREPMKADAAFRFRTAMVEDASSSLISGANWLEVEKGEEFPFPVWPFRHMGMESMAVLSCAMNESLLQSYDGVIRVAPAVRKDQSAKFTLHAAEGFVVSAEIRDGMVLWTSIWSLRGNTFRIANPWGVAYLRSHDGKPILCDGETVEFATAVEGRYLLSPEQDIAGAWKVEPTVRAANEAPKTHDEGTASLGLCRMF